MSAKNTANRHQWNVKKNEYLCRMRMALEKAWNRWKETVKFVGWGLAVTLVCFLLCKVCMNRNTTHHLVPLSAEKRDSLMTIKVPQNLSDTLLKYQAFIVHFNSERGIANCAAYELNVAELEGDAARANIFMPDMGVKGCPLPGDYAGSGLERGHLVPAGDMKWNDEAMRQSFLLTNVCPMHKALNEGGWAKLEEKVREWTRRDSTLLVFTGPVVNDGDSTLTNSKVTVPGSFYKVVLAPCVQPARAIAFIYPNGYSGGRLQQYAVSVDEVERRTGLDFFPTLPDEEQQRLENPVCLDAWLN